MKIRKWEIGRYTQTQLINALDQSDPKDPHSGGISIDSLDELMDY